MMEVPGVQSILEDVDGETCTEQQVHHGRVFEAGCVLCLVEGR